MNKLSDRLLVFALTIISALAILSVQVVSADAPVRIALDPETPGDLVQAVERLIDSDKYIISDPAEAQVRLMQGAQTGFGARWMYVPVVPFPTVADNITMADMLRFWAGDPSGIRAMLSSPAGGDDPVLYTTRAGYTFLETRFGIPPARSVRIQLVPVAGIRHALWMRRGRSFGFMPFDALSPKLKALHVDDMDVFDRALDLTRYPFMDYYGWSGDSDLLLQLADDLHTYTAWPESNRDPALMTALAMTGVTALTRATAYEMEQTGITRPARDIALFLAGADLVHTSNEVSFTPDCPYPRPQSGVTFCSRDTYFDLLKTIHLSVVELTGNHGKDYGVQPFLHSLDLYEQAGITYYGGGRNLPDARKGIVITHNGNRVGFIGCNPVGPVYAWAIDANTPGAAPCDNVFIRDEIRALRSRADVIIMTIQYLETYRYAPTTQQVVDFNKYAAMGVDIVIGSQAHQPQSFTFTGETFIHYGMGNLFFDQMNNIATRQLFADKLIFYRGRHISTVLFTGLIEDYSRPRPMTPAERTDFLGMMFDVSAW